MWEWARGVLEQLGYGGLVLFMFLENVFPPIPSELVMPFGGYTAARGDMHLGWVIVAGMAGSVLGAIPLYYLGHLVGRQRLERWADRHGKWLTVWGCDIAKAHEWFERRGGRAVFLARFVPGVRSLISIPAGVVHMPMWRFLLLTAIGTAGWASILAVAGYALGSRYEQIGAYLDPITYAVLGAVLLWYLVRLVRELRQGGRTERRRGEAC